MIYFTFYELEHSVIAEARGIDNTPTPEVEERLNLLVDLLLDPIREAWGAPIYVTSGYRSEALNREIKGAPDSQHIRGEAVDITAGAPYDNHKLFGMIKTAFEFDQLIEYNDYRWLHLSFTVERKNRKMVLHTKTAK